MASVIIAIQARSTSARLPEKILADIEGKPMLQHVIDACKKSERHIKFPPVEVRTVKDVQVIVCCPTGDKLIKVIDSVPIIQGPEHDVLSRYMVVYNAFHPDYVVRITGDCPLVHPAEITKHINTAAKNHFDYVSNVDENIRTVFDGADCEVISSKLLIWLNDHAKSVYDREHVTTLARSAPPKWAKTAFIIGRIFTADTKLSVDTEEDLERVRFQIRKINEAERYAKNKYGQNCVFKH